MALAGALRRLLKPLVRLLIASSIPYPVFIRLLKSVYVEVADREFPVKGKEQTDSRISLLTGVHRKDVRRLRETSMKTGGPPPVITLGSQLVARWTGMPRYLDKHGHPSPLPRLSRESGSPSFDELVQSISRDIRPRAVLDEWLRLGVARVDEKDRVWLNTEAFVPEKGFDEKAFYFGENLHDHIAAGAHNLLARQPPFMERSVHSNELSEASATELAALANAEGTKALLAVSRRALELEERDATQGKPRQRINFGVYFYQEDLLPPDPDD